MSGITDEREFDEFRKTIDWNGYAQKVKGAYLVACGEYDQLCPLEYTEAFMRALGGPKQLLVYEGGNHSVALTTATSNGPPARPNLTGAGIPGSVIGKLPSMTPSMIPTNTGSTCG